MLCKDFIFNLQDYSRIDWLYKVVWTQTPVLIAIGFCLTRASQATQVIKNLPASAGDIRDSALIPGLGTSPGKRKMATHSSILARKIPWTEETGGRQSVGFQSQT